MDNESNNQRNNRACVSIRDFRDTSDRTLFISSEVTERHPYVHHCYIYKEAMHYLVFDPLDDIVMEHYAGDSLDHSIIEYEKSAKLNFFDLEAFSLMSRLILARETYYSRPERIDERFHTKIMEDISLKINAEQILSTGCLIESHNLANTVMGIKIRRTLILVSDCLSNIINDCLENNNGELATLAVRYTDVVDEIALSIINSMPVSLSTINEFKQLILRREVLDKITSHPEFISLECSKYFDLMIGKSFFTTHPSVIKLKSTLSEDA